MQLLQGNSDCVKTSEIKHDKRLKNNMHFKNAAKYEFCAVD